MFKNITKYWLIFLCFNPYYLNAQITTSFIPSIHGQTLEGLSFAQVLNSTQETIHGKMIIKVRSVSEGEAVRVQSPLMHFQPGLNNIDRILYSKSSISFGRNNAGNVISQTGKISEGEYEYCYEIIVDDAKNIALIGSYENCFTSVIQPLSPLILINPADGDEICNTRPDFSWQPPMPVNIHSRFELVVSEIKEKQTPVEALTYNLPAFTQANITGSILLFPQYMQSLTKGKRYAWQVAVYNNKTIITKSEIWVFSVDCKEEKDSIERDSYRELKLYQDGNFYVAKKILRFSFNNPYNEGDLQYRIVPVSSPEKEIKGLEKLIMKSGINKYDIDLTENRFIKNGQQYILDVSLANGRSLQLRFIYQD